MIKSTNNYEIFKISYQPTFICILQGVSIHHKNTALQARRVIHAYRSKRIVVVHIVCLCAGFFARERKIHSRLLKHSSQSNRSLGRMTLPLAWHSMDAQPLCVGFKTANDDLSMIKDHHFTPRSSPRVVRGEF